MPLKSDRTRPDLLFLSPIMPFGARTGLALRAGHLLEAAARRFRVHLHVVPVAGGAREPNARAAAAAERISVLDPVSVLDTHAGLIARLRDPDERHRQIAAYPRPWLSRACTPSAARRIEEWLGQTRPAVVLAMRLYLAPLASPLLEGEQHPFGLLDLDDDDALTFGRIAALHQMAGDSEAAARAAAEATKFALLARQMLPCFDAVSVCSDGDQARLAAEHLAARVVVLPNICDQPTPVPHRPADAAQLRLLFVGSLAYPPNADAARWLAAEILPALHANGLPARLDIIGGGDPGLLARAASVTLHGEVDDLTPFYRDADIALAPLRAGGGTRLKILEAFAHGVPVVASDIGIEGLAAQDGRHYLRANCPAEFANACRRLRDEPALAGQLTAEARLFVALEHSAPALDRQLAALLDRRGGLA